MSNLVPSAGQEEESLSFVNLSLAIRSCKPLRASIEDPQGDRLGVRDVRLAETRRLLDDEF